MFTNVLISTIVLAHAVVLAPNANAASASTAYQSERSLGASLHPSQLVAVHAPVQNGVYKTEKEKKGLVIPSVSKNFQNNLIKRIDHAVEGLSKFS